jgi:hypothetical protein
VKARFASVLVAMVVLAGLGVSATACGGRQVAVGGQVTPGPPKSTAPPSQPLSSVAGNWAGYWVDSGHFKSVKATWTQPALTRGGKLARAASVWVGLDGVTNGHVEQIGTGSVVQGRWHMTVLFYEMFPLRSVLHPPGVTGTHGGKTVIRPGDTITAEVTYLGHHRFRLALTDRTRHERFSTVQTSMVARRVSAEIIVEGPDVARHRLAHFRPVHFTACEVDGRPLGDWPLTRTSIGPDSGPFATSTSPLGNDGASFTVTRR